MALEKIAEFNNTGITGQYWRIIAVGIGEIQPNILGVNLQVALYINEENRRLNKHPIEVINVVVREEEFAQYFTEEWNVLRAAGYSLLKTRQELTGDGTIINFTEAIDC